MPDPRPRLAGLIAGTLVVLGAAAAWWAVSARHGSTTAGMPAVLVDVVQLDVIEAFGRAGPEVRIVAQDAEAPLQCAPAVFEKDAGLASDAAHKVIRAQAESAFEIRAGPFLPGAVLVARTMVYSAFRTDPERVDPAPVTYRILVDGQERARLGSEYVREMEVDSPYDQVLRTLRVPLDPGPGAGPGGAQGGRAGGPVTLRFETTRGGQPVPAGVTPAEPLWWELRVVQRVPVPRQASSPSRPNVLLLMVDTLAAGHTSLCGYSRRTTPELESLAQGGTVFEQAVAPASWTLPSVATLFTGLPPNTHGVLGDTRSYLMDGLVTWPEMLRQSGVPGLAVVANPLVCKGGNFQQGFDDWQQATNENARALNGRLLAWIDAQPAPGRWFAYVHYMEPHAPYAAPGEARAHFCDDYVEHRPFGGNLPGQLQRGEIEDFSPAARQHLVDLYDGEVAFLDACVGELRAALQVRSLLDRTLVVLVADHGEELFEHGRLGHGFSLFEEQIRVPLLLVGPGVPAGLRVAARTGTAGLANTLLLLAGSVKLPDAADALFPLPGAVAARSPVFSTVRTQLFGPRHSLVSASDDAARKVVVTLDEQGGLVGVERFDRSRDAREAVPLPAEGLAADEAAAWDALQGEATQWFTDTAARRPAGEQPHSPEIDAGLEQLGYTGSAGH